MPIRSIYNLHGELIKIVSGSVKTLSVQEIPEGGGYVEGGWDGRFYYVVDDTPTERPAMSCQTNSTTISNLPIPCSVTVNGETIEVPDGTLELSFGIPGTYKVKVVAWPYLDWEGVINAV